MNTALALVVGIPVVTLLLTIIYENLKDRKESDIYLHRRTVDRLEGKRANLSDKGWKVID